MKYELGKKTILVLQNFMLDLDLMVEMAENLKDNGAYNRLNALKMNIKDFIDYFEKRKEKILVKKIGV